MKARECYPPFIPPRTDISNLLRIRAEVTLKLITELR
jgi:hypothetical protein